MLLIDLEKESLFPADAFGWTKEEKTSRQQGIMEDRNQPILQGSIEINEKIAA